MTHNKPLHPTAASLRSVSRSAAGERLGVIMRSGVVTIAVLATLVGTGACATRSGHSMRDVQHLSVYIDRPPSEVYDFAPDPRNLPRRAAGLARSEVKREGDVWIMDSPLGKVTVRFAARNAFGVLDHDVTLESGVTLHNPMRVVPHGRGSEFMFTLIRPPTTSDEQFAADRAAVEEDLNTLKGLLEQRR